MAVGASVVAVVGAVVTAAGFGSAVSFCFAFSGDLLRVARVQRFSTAADCSADGVAPGAPSAVTGAWALWDAGDPCG